MSSPIDGLIAALASNLKLSNAVAAATSAEEANKIAENAGYKVGANELLNAYKNEIMELTVEELYILQVKQPKQNNHEHQMRPRWKNMYATHQSSIGNVCFAKQTKEQ